METTKRILIFLIGVYQKAFSPDHGFLRYFRARGACKFYPTCSEYACAALAKHSTTKAIYLSIKRLLRCNPFSRGGIDYP